MAPLIANRPGSTCLWTGIVTRIDEAGVGWGEAQGSIETFDYPMPDGYGVGSRVEMYAKDKTEEQEEGLMIIIRHQDKDRVMMSELEETDDGFEIIESFEFAKPETQQ